MFSWVVLRWEDKDLSRNMREHCGRASQAQQLAGSQHLQWVKVMKGGASKKGTEVSLLRSESKAMSFMDDRVVRSWSQGHTQQIRGVKTTE